MLRNNHLLEKVKDIYGTPGSLSSERRKAFFKVTKPISEVEEDLKFIDQDVNYNFYILPYENESIVGMNI